MRAQRMEMMDKLMQEGENELFILVYQNVMTHIDETLEEVERQRLTVLSEMNFMGWDNDDHKLNAENILKEYTKSNDSLVSEQLYYSFKLYYVITTIIYTHHRYDHFRLIFLKVIV